MSSATDFDLDIEEPARGNGHGAQPPLHSYDDEVDRAEGWWDGDTFVEPERVPLHEIGRRPTPPVPCLVPGLIPYGTLSAFVGPGGVSNKTRTAMAVAAGVAIGRPALPSFTLGDCAGQRNRVSVIENEEPPAVMESMVSDIRRVHRLTDKEFRDLALMMAVYAQRFGLLVDSEGRTTDFYGWLQHHIETRQPRLVVLDPVVDFVTFSSSDTDGANRAFKLLLELVRGKQTALLLVDHAIKNEKAWDEAKGMAGPASKANAVRSILSFDPIKRTDGMGAQVRLVHTKHNWSPRHPDIFITNEGGAVVEVAGAATAAADLRVAVAHRLAELLRESPETLSLRDIRKGENPAASKIKQALSAEFGRGVSGDKLDEAVQHGLSTGVLVTENMVTKGPPKLAIRAGETYGKLESTDVRQSTEKSELSESVSQ